MKNKVGIVSCDKWINKIKEDLFLQKELLNNGIDSQIISWEDQSVDYSEFKCLILRSVWGYQNNYIQFREWLLYLKDNDIAIYNDVDMIMNNIRKDKQFEILDRNSIPHIPTSIIRNLNDLTILYESDGSKVIKPLISGSGQNTYLIDSNNRSILKEDNGFREMLSSIIAQKENGIILQPYISEISNGEYACIFIDGINTHNMLRFPGIFSEKKSPIYIEGVPENVKKLAHSVSMIPEFSNYLYMRVDIVVSNNEPKIMEVELAEPDLLIKYISDENIQKQAIKTFAKKIERRI